ncbi:MAG: 2-oxoacid:acceptor oxidoreductase family protein [Kiritimatiellia bacterium]
MSDEMLEIRWHGRGGQGAKTAAQLVAQVALKEGKHSQGFPEYGPERMGAPIRGFTRISEEDIHLHCPIEHPDVVVVLDDSLTELPPVTESVDKDTIFIINTAATPEEMAKKLGMKEARVYCVDAMTISIDELGRAIPNTPMIGALIKATDCISLDSIKKNIKDKFLKKFGDRIVEGNIRAIDRAYEEVKSQ